MPGGPRPYAGYSIITDPGLQRPIEQDYLQCGHCNAHYPVQPGSGKTRGFCLVCYRATCGKPECNPCVPFERKLEMMERPNGQSLDYRIQEEAGRKKLWGLFDKYWQPKH